MQLSANQKHSILTKLNIIVVAKQKGLKYSTLEEVSNFSKLSSLPDSTKDSHQTLKRAFLLNEDIAEEILFGDDEKLKEAYDSFWSKNTHMNTNRIIDFYDYFEPKKRNSTSPGYILKSIQEILALDTLPSFSAQKIFDNYTFIKSNSLDIRYLQLEKLLTLRHWQLKELQERDDFEELINLFVQMDKNKLLYSTLDIDKPAEMLSLLPEILERNICTQNIFQRPVLVREVKTFLSSKVPSPSSETQYFSIVYPDIKILLETTISDSIKNTIIFAARNKKKVFIELCTKYIEKFLQRNTYKSVLFTEDFRRVVNLNTLNDESFCKLLDTSENDVSLENFTTPLLPAEVIALTNQSKYISEFYSLLDCKFDVKLRVLKELSNLKVELNITKEKKERLAKVLSIKTLSEWRNSLFNIKTVVSLSTLLETFTRISPEEISKVSNEIKSDADLLFLSKYKSSVLKHGLTIAKRDYIYNSDEVKSFLSNLQVADITSFTNNYADSLISFIEAGMLEVYNKYSRSLSNKSRKDILENFNRITKSELMGKLDMVKYNEGDLAKEIKLEVTPEIQFIWKENLNIGDARETYDYKTIMELGVKPVKSCMNFDGGSYCHCLISNFDSNKKIIASESNGSITGRAIFRLTKSSLLKPSELNTMLEFVDVEKIYSTDKAEERKQEILDSRKLTLFLEKPYIADNNEGVREEFVKLAIEKAKLLKARLVFAGHYDDLLRNTKLGEFKSIWVYISKSKNGFHYLDSFGGSADENAGGKYKEGYFYVADFSNNSL